MTDTDHRANPVVIVYGGKHDGKPITRVPAVFLQWMVSVKHPLAADARRELKRRGTVMPSLEISGHALDRASLKCHHQWKKDRRDDEGLHAWLLRISAEAIRTAKPKGDAIFYKGLRFIFEFDCEWPVLKTVMLDERKSKRVTILNQRSN